MGFLDYWRKREPEEVQGNLLNPEEQADAIVDRAEPTRLASYHRLHGELKARGAMDQTHQAINHLQNIEMLDDDYRKLYEELGITLGQRAKLPKEAKEALMVGDIAAFHQIMKDDAQGHQALIESSYKGFKQARKLFPW
ncbi:MAG: hypothetical protein HC857_09970 [Synechococcales cyanobacterium RU_4_20]|nr:hypothetical protein [Synechococcales cyanobacterium RU_4_20]NJR67476.1 hypothetical protein [Synechococcales cyanobacterium CRU_2_2]